MNSSEYLTTREVAELLRLKERKVYDMAADNSIPCTRATGKLLFSRSAINQWLQQHSTGSETTQAIALISGSHDPLLEWAIRESECGIATLFDGSMDGCTRLHSAQATVAAIHIFNAATQRWNVDFVETTHANDSCVLVSFVKRQRGIVHRSDIDIKDISAFATHSVAVRQAGAGSQIVLDALLTQAGVDYDALNVTTTARTELDAVLAVVEGVADCTLGLQSLAAQHRLGFVPLIDESLDLLVQRRFWFEPQMQTLIRFCRSEAFLERVAFLEGYTMDDSFSVKFNP